MIRVGSVFALLFLYVPLALVFVYAFNNRIGQKWPIDSFTTKYWAQAWHNSDLHAALANSLVIASVATVVALVLGSLAAFAVHRFRFFGRNSISFLLLLPIALPGIVTGIALNASINNFGITFSLYTIMIGHITFCIVVVYNNVIARLRRTPTSLIEASQDLGAGGWQTFRYVTFPAHPHRARGGCPAGVRALVRRDRRDELHVGRRAHDPEVHLQQRAAAAGTGRS